VGIDESKVVNADVAVERSVWGRFLLCGLIILFNLTI
jgi:hypothetical protein